MVLTEILIILQIYSARSVLFFFLFNLWYLKSNYSFLHNTGLQWASPTNQHQNMSGSAKILRHGYCLDATTHGWCDTTARRYPLSHLPTCDVWECYWTMTLDLCLFMMLSPLSTCIRLTFPLHSQSVRCSMCGTGV